MYSFTNQVKFCPYIGCQYGTGSEFKMPLLLLGKKHYNEDNDDATTDFTAKVVEKHLSGRDRQIYLDLITQAIKGGSVSQDAEKSFWDSIAFYNYIQEMTAEPKEEPTLQMWENAQSPFEEVVSTLKPSCILVLGQGLIKRLSIPSPSRQFGQTGKLINSCIFMSAYIGATDSPIKNLYQPEAWHPSIKELLDAARKGA